MGPVTGGATSDVSYACLDWTVRLLRGALPHTAGFALIFVWILGGEIHRGPLLVWLAWTALTTTLALWNARSYRQARLTGRTGGRAGARQPYFVALVASVWGLAPWLIDTSRSTSAGPIALVFPMAAAGLLMIVTAPVRSHYLVAFPTLFFPVLLWMVLQEDPLLGRLTLAGFGYGLMLLFSFGALHRQMRRTVELSFGNASLIAEMHRDRDQIARSNELLAEANRRLTDQAMHDSLTGLVNRRGLLDQLDAEAVAISRTERSMLVMFCDVDRFKVINDSLGHAAGDHLLAVLASRLSAMFPPPHLLARLGGDEFVIAIAPPAVRTRCWRRVGWRSWPARRSAVRSSSGTSRSR